MEIEFLLILKPSDIGGVGVFAAIDIPQGTEIFNKNFTRRKLKISSVPDAFRSYCVYIDDEYCLCPERFDCMEIRWYVNHSFTPNIEKCKNGLVISKCKIKAGEEILLDYNQLGEPDEMKEAYYQKT
jgi:SET domain-containing protein